ncbi:DUF898 family protein [Methylovirgula sp. 4M-Z18]|nr:DUF898 family protein [Methylovirgula sp. 4M-Z18]RFB75037.1 DUF898 family protein [Methylovirgula sp. 4M-Z18]
MNEQTPVFSPAAEPGARSGRIDFSGQGGDFFSLAARGALLQLVTFGFYRFWLTTRCRQYLWSRTRLDGAHFEYAGTGRELLIGFLFALAILAPVYVLYSLLTIEAQRYSAFAAFPMILFFYLFGQFAVFRARRYRLTRTIWRGVRFWMTGSGWTYALKALFWMLLVGITLGFAYPWSLAALERYKIGHTHYGDMNGEFTGKGLTLFKKTWWIAAIFALLIAAYFYVMIRLAVAINSANLGHAQPQDLPGGGWAVFAFVAFAIALFVLLPVYQAIEWRWWASNLRLGDLRVRSDLGNGAFLGLYGKFIGLLILLGVLWGIAASIIFIPLFKSLIFDLAASAGAPQWRAIAAIYAGMVVFYVPFLLALGVLQRYFLQYGFWRRFVASISVDNLQAADHVKAMGSAASALGEGLADGLDVAGF